MKKFFSAILTLLLMAAGDCVYSQNPTTIYTTNGLSVYPPTVRAGRVVVGIDTNGTGVIRRLSVTDTLTANVAIINILSNHVVNVTNLTLLGTMNANGFALTNLVSAVDSTSPVTLGQMLSTNAAFVRVNGTTPMTAAWNFGNQALTDVADLSVTNSFQVNNRWLASKIFGLPHVYSVNPDSPVRGAWRTHRALIGTETNWCVGYYDGVSWWTNVVISSTTNRYTSVMSVEGGASGVSTTNSTITVSSTHSNGLVVLSPTVSIVADGNTNATLFSVLATDQRNANIVELLGAKGAANQTNLVVTRTGEIYMPTLSTPLTFGTQTPAKGDWRFQRIVEGTSTNLAVMQYDGSVWTTNSKFTSAF